MADAAAPLVDLRAGGKRALAVALARIEADPQAPATLALLDAAYAGAKGQVLGLTGPPGVGKSTLTAAVLRRLRAAGLTVGVIAVDPSSRRSGGALLGDRLRLDADPEDQGLFIRSMAARASLGGLAWLTMPAMVLMRAVFDRVIIETVGVGQSETAIGEVADSVVLCIQPASGDSLQYMKAGIAELPDIVVIGKADLGAPARKAAHDVKAALAVALPAGGWTVPVLQVSAQSGQGIDELLAALDRHGAHLAAHGRLAARRQAQAEAWLAVALRDEVGRLGVARAATLPGGLALSPGESPFRRIAALLQALSR